MDTHDSTSWKHLLEAYKYNVTWLSIIESYKLESSIQALEEEEEEEWST